MYTRPQMGGEATRITTDGGVYRYGQHGRGQQEAFVLGQNNKLWYVGVDDKKPVLVDKGDYGAIGDATWSPDSRWLTYSKPHRRGANDVFLYSLETKKATQLSSGFYNDNNPVFDHNGKYLYFISTDSSIRALGSSISATTITRLTAFFAVTLKADEESPFKPQSDEEKAADEKKKDDADKKTIRKKTKKPATRKEGRQERRKEGREKEEPVKPIQVDLTGSVTASRRFRCPPRFSAGLRVARTNFSTSPRRRRPANSAPTTSKSRATSCMFTT